MVLSWILNIVAFLLIFIALGFCIFAHELGHFLAAKWRGLHVDAFSLGFRPFWRKKINGVEYRLGWLPFGGYVELPQVDATDAVPHAADGTELPRAKPLDRIITAVAGPLFNVISGLMLGCIIWWVGMPQDTPKMRELHVLTVDDAGPEWKAGLRPGDTIVKINKKPFHAAWREVILDKILLTVGAVDLEVLRDGKPVQISYTPAENPNAPNNLKAERIAWPFFTVQLPIQLNPKSGSPAQKAGIQKGDMLVTINDKPILDPNDFLIAIDAAGSENSLLKLGVRRDGEIINVSVQPEPEKMKDEYYRIGVTLEDQKSANGIFVAGFSANSPAREAGFLAGDRISKLNGKAVASSSEFINQLQLRKLEPSTIEFEREGKLQTLEITPKLLQFYTIGAMIASFDHPTPIQLLVNTFEMSRKSLVAIGVGIGNRLGLTEQTSSIRASHMSGPLGIGMIIFSSSRMALEESSHMATALYFVVVISFALAIFNLLPLPVLDGGHIVFGLIEIIFRRPLPTVVIKGLSMVFVVLLIGLMIFVTISDGRRLARVSGLTERVSTWLPTEDANQTETIHADDQTN